MNGRILMARKLNDIQARASTYEKRAQNVKMNDGITQQQRWMNRKYMMLKIVVLSATRC
jgi:hypothetical protein